MPARPADRFLPSPVPAGTAPVGAATDTVLSVTLLAAIGLALAVQLIMACFREINWDEFYFLAHVYESQRGALTDPVQTAYVHAFGWLTALPGNEIDRIVVARLVMLVLEAGTCAMIYLAGRRLVSSHAALLAVLSYLAGAYVTVHGAAFRADPMATFLLMSAIVLLLRPRLRWVEAVASGALVALAGLVTIKSAFYLPVVVMVGLWRIREADDRLRRLLLLAAGAAAGAAAFALLFLLHRHSLAPSPAADVAGTVGGDMEKVFGAGAFDGTSRYLRMALLLSPMAFAAIILGAVLALGAAGRGRQDGMMLRLTLLSFAVPLASLFFYRNSFPYYYVFVLAPAAVLAALAFEQLRSPLVRLAFVGVFGLAIGLQFSQGIAAGQDVQRRTLAAIHTMFPDPVPYIDRCFLVGSYPGAGFFMSTWGIESYRAAGRPILREAIARVAPRFVLADSATLAEALAPGTFDLPDGLRLLDADATELHDNYVHQWGDIWVAGRTLAGLAPGEVRDMPIRAAGPYTIEAAGPVTIDGVARQPGEVVALDSTIHRVASATRQTVVLRWGDHLPRPATPEPTAPMFMGF